uniref:Ig-like domain-containing protein n=1 Tax=Neogobius melanostomus TaxID=47308 RepID=A0A8C6TCZ2_9GOBI
MWMFKAITVLYLSAAVATQDSGEALPVPRVHLQSQWSEIFPPEQVRLRCDVNGKDWTVIWYRDEQEIQTTDTSVILSEDAQNLTLKAEAQTQSGKYSCKGFHKSNASLSTQDSNALQITVHGQKLKPALSVSGDEQDVLVGQSVTFRCGIDVLSSWEYYWYLNDNTVHKSTVDVYTVQSAEEAHNGKYHCKVKRGGVFVSNDSNTVSVKVSDVPKPRVTLVSSWSDVIEKEQVLLRCETDGPDWSFTWFRGGEQLTESPNIKFSDDGGAQLIMSSVTKTLQGLYTCKAEHNANKTSDLDKATQSGSQFMTRPHPHCQRTLL